MNKGLIEQVVNFVREIFTGLDSGYLFFGGPVEIVRYVFDIILITFVVYQLLKLLRQTRAWQLLQGLFLIILFTMICSILGLEMVGFIFDNILYVVAIAFVVIFQPELRKALETVGLRSFSTFSNALSPEYQEGAGDVAAMIDHVVRACSEMSKSYTGALIIIERNSKLSELLEQENVVSLDSSVTKDMLLSIFFKGSPLHDGAVLIRNNRISAARCHVPLSESVHTKVSFGTRHRAAVGASEMGDAISVAVSEERGKISLAMDGCLYEMRGGDELKKNLLYIFGIAQAPGRSKRKGRRVVNPFAKPSIVSTQKPSEEMEEIIRSKQSDFVDGEIVAVSAVSATCPTDKSQKTGSPVSASSSTEPPVTAKRDELRINGKISRKIMYILASFVISLSLWMYIQINNNPVIEKQITVPLQFLSEETLANNDLKTEYTIENVSIILVGRKSVMDELSDTDIGAYIDYSPVQSEGLYTLRIAINSEKNVYYRVKSQNPETIAVNAYQSGD
ncbi:MAG: TIGR00159 family protein [Clostridiaceae bacterium]|nr:diadenylate cyclase CdaA [Oscillospiraceae bacterium]NLO62403.1 TIGR00159 family protein [Clostridiaceae bacterium]